MDDLQEYFKHSAAVTEKWLNERLINYSSFSAGLTQAMRYSVFAGGKRLRPALMYASYGIFCDDIAPVVPYAAAVEVLHTYSLIHDDLPAMDNDDLRRGKPTCHKAFGEAEAILAGDALLTKAFEFASDKENTHGITDAIRIKAIHALALAAGDRGMVAGQFADIKAENVKADGETVHFIHLNKTAALIKYCVSMGAILSGRGYEDEERLGAFGQNLGLAFQITDDILDLTSDSFTLGKDAGSDLENGKATYPAVYGIEKSAEMAAELVQECVKLIKPYGKRGNRLSEIALFITERKS